MCSRPRPPPPVLVVIRLLVIFLGVGNRATIALGHRRLGAYTSATSTTAVSVPVWLLLLPGALGRRPVEERVHEGPRGGVPQEVPQLLDAMLPRPGTGHKR